MRVFKRFEFLNMEESGSSTNGGMGNRAAGCNLKPSGDNSGTRIRIDVPRPRRNSGGMGPAAESGPKKNPNLNASNVGQSKQSRDTASTQSQASLGGASWAHNAQKTKSPMYPSFSASRAAVEPPGREGPSPHWLWWWANHAGLGPLPGQPAESQAGLGARPSEGQVRMLYVGRLECITAHRYGIPEEILRRT